MEHISKKRRSIIAECNQDEAPDMLFHYTSIESLALILSNKTLRLKSLTTLDDPEEAMAQDSQGFARYVFVSCWTEDKTESIPMWNMYAGLQSGVRIEMEPDPFKRYRYSEQDYSEALNVPLSNIKIEGDAPELFLPLETIKRFAVPNIFDGANLLRKVEYTDDPDKLVPQIAAPSDQGGICFAAGKLGVCKNAYWEFQHEWRYVLQAIPMNTMEVLENPKRTLNRALGSVLNQAEPALTDHFDLEIDERAFRRMRFVLSPKISPGNRVLAESLLSRYGLADRIAPSELIGRL